MASTKRVMVLLFRVFAVALALGFLVWHVRRARVESQQVFASSKNARVLTAAADQYLLEASRRAKSDAGREAATEAPPLIRGDAWVERPRWQAGSPSPAMLSSSKSMSQPVVRVGDVLPWWSPDAGSAERDSPSLIPEWFLAPFSSRAFVEAPVVRVVPEATAEKADERP